MWFLFIYEAVMVVLSVNYRVDSLAAWIGHGQPNIWRSRAVKDFISDILTYSIHY